MNYDVNVIMRKFVEAQLSSTPFYLNPHCTVGMLAKKLGTNRTYLSRFINEECDTNYEGLMRRLRLAYAERLMHDHPEWPFVYVANRSGFNSDTTFRKAFFEKYGMSPRDYILRHGKM